MIPQTIRSDAESGESTPPLEMKLGKKDTSTEANSKEVADDGTPPVDIMAQQLKFVACLKILMEELSTLATGFEVDGRFLSLLLYPKPKKTLSSDSYNIRLSVTGT